MTPNDTIAAISTPPGRGGIGVIRLSGPDAVPVAAPLLRLTRPLSPGRARRVLLVDPATGAPLDDAIVTFFAAPRSYTTEDVVEISCHGAPVLLAAVLAACLAAGARLAQPGEFTQRAFLAGRLDLTEAEAVHDLVAATTLAQARVAAAQLGGSVSRAVAPLRQQLVALIAELEAGVDFAEDDLDLLPASALTARLAELAATLTPLVESFRFGRVLHTGFTLAIAGRPNAGKSALFNRLLRQDRAIVTDQPGTTRDPIAETLELGGIPVRLVDTAGLRLAPEGPAGEPERQGIERSRQILAEADVVLLVQDLSAPGEPAATPSLTGQPAQDPELTALAAAARNSVETGAETGAAGRPVLCVGSKADLPRAGAPSLPPGLIPTSALTGEGIETLREAILTAVTGPASTEAETAVVTSLRQHTALAAALGSLHAARRAADAALPHELLLLDLYAALESLDQLTGVPDRDEVLHLIFSTFCIGK